jgi:hypothetical protein
MGGGLVGIWLCKGERGENGGLPNSNGGGSGLGKLVVALILGYHGQLGSDVEEEHPCALEEANESAEYTACQFSSVGVRRPMRIGR